MNGDIRIGFIGFGDVASTFARELLDRGARVCAFDHKLLRSDGQAILRARACSEAIEFRSLVELVDNVTVILSTVSSESAYEAARDCAPLLGRNHVFVDLNSVGPSTKHAIRKLIEASGATFVEGAILGAIRSFGATTRILMCGPHAERIVSMLRKLGLNAELFGLEIGTASTFKMLRSVFSKSIEAAILETLIAAELLGMRENVWFELVSTFATQPFDALAMTWITTHPTAHQRRLAEISDVCALLRESGLTPRVTEGALSFFRQSASLKFARLHTRESWTTADVIKTMAEQLRNGA